MPPLDQLINAARGGKLVLAPGEYEISAPVEIPSHFTLEGSGVDRTVIKVANGAQCTALLLKDATLSRICNLTVNGNKSNNPRKPDPHSIGEPLLRGTWDQAGIELKSCGNCVLDNIRVIDCAWNGVVLSGTTDCWIINCASDNNGNVTVRTPKPAPDDPEFGKYWNQFEAFGFLFWDAYGFGNIGSHVERCSAGNNEKHGIEILGRLNKRNTIKDCFVYENSGGIVVNAWGSVETGNIIDCRSYKNREGGFWVIGERCRISGCHSDQDVQGPPLSRYSPGSQVPPVHAGGVSLHGSYHMAHDNIVMQPGDGGGGSGFGIYSDGDLNSISRNLVINSHSTGILSNKSAQVCGNIVEKAGFLGIQSNGGEDAAISDNSVLNSKLDGIYADGVSNGRLIISGNRIDGARNGILLIEKPHSVICGNLIRNVSHQPINLEKSSQKGTTVFGNNIIGEEGE